MGISVNGPSGIDTTSLIEQLIELEETNKIVPVEEKIDKYENSLSAYTQLSSLISDLASKAEALNEDSDFNCFNESSTDEEIATISGSTDCQAGSYSLRVFHTATQEKLVSKNNVISSQSESLSSLGIGTGTISINGVEISIDDDDTIQDLRSKVNNATDEDGDSIGVTASVIKLSDSNFRFVLTATDSGSSGASYSDVSGSVLQNLGIITTADGEKDIENQQYTSSEDIRSTISSLTEGEYIEVAGKDHDGNEITKKILITQGLSESEFIDEINAAFNGTVTAEFTDSGNLKVTDNIGGDSEFELSFTSFPGSSVPTMELTVSGYSGSGVLTCGSNAYFNIDGLAVNSESNDVEDVIVGATIHINEADADTDVNLTIELDKDEIKTKITDFVDSYNALHDFIKTETTRANSEEDEDSEDGDLVGDSTVSSILSNISSMIRQQFASSGSIKSFTSLGITTDYSTGELTVDDDELDDALQTNFNDVLSFFTTSGYSENTGVTLGRYGDSTSTGNYEIERSGENTYRIRLSGSSEWYESDTTTGEIVKFSDGPAAGLSLTIQSSAMEVGDTTTFNFYKGFGDTLDTACDKLTSTKTGSEGIIKLRTTSIQRNIDYSNDRIDMLYERIERYQDRLTKQYANMELVLNTMQTQMSDLLSSISSSS